MMSRQVKLNYLRAFDAAARHLSFSAAAEEMNLSQAAISQQIARLEHALGSDLFIRRNRALSLSERGLAYHLVVREVLDRLDAVTGQIFPAESRRTVSVRCTPSVASQWLVPRLGAFHRAYPGTDIRIQTLDLYPERRQSPQADLTIYRAAEGHDADAETRLLWRAEIFPVGGRGYLERFGPIAGPADIARCDLIDIMGYTNNWHRWLRRFAPACPPPAPAVTLDGLNMAIEAACRGEGLILGRRPLIDAYLEDGRLIPALEGEFSLYSPYYLRLNPASPRRAAARTLADWMLGGGRAAAGDAGGQSRTRSAFGS